MIAYAQCSNGMGLGNCLFVISAAIYYCETYGYHLKVIKNKPSLFGTSTDFGKHVCHKNCPYSETIFKRLTFTEIAQQPLVRVHNDFTDNLVVPTSNLLVTGFNQNLNLFRSVLSKIPNYLNFDDEIVSYLKKKYLLDENSTCIGVRRGSDFAHMKKLTPSSYERAIEHIKQINPRSKFYVISDTPTSEFFNDISEPLIEVCESDIVQLCFGMLCNQYILSESTFHLWIAYLGTINSKKTVVCFNDTDITNRNLDLEGWIKLDY
jgi:hypothetical protein